MTGASTIDHHHKLHARTAELEIELADVRHILPDGYAKDARLSLVIRRREELWEWQEHTLMVRAFLAEARVRKLEAALDRAVLDLAQARSEAAFNGGEARKWYDKYMDREAGA